MVDLRIGNLVRSFLDLSHMAQLDLLGHYADSHKSLATDLMAMHAAIDEVGESGESHTHQIDLNARSIKEITKYPQKIAQELLSFLQEIIKRLDSLESIKPLTVEELKAILDTQATDEEKIQTLVRRIGGSKYIGEYKLVDDLLELPIELTNFSPSFLVNLNVKRPTSTADLFNTKFGHHFLGNSEMSLMFTSMVSFHASRHSEIYESGIRTAPYFLGDDKVKGRLKQQIPIIYQLVKNYNQSKGSTKLCLQEYRSLRSFLREVEDGRLTADDMNRALIFGEAATHQMVIDLSDISNILNKARKANLVSIYDDDRFFLK
jgi:hypothetical protein